MLSGFCKGGHSRGPIVAWKVYNSITYLYMMFCWLIPFQNWVNSLPDENERQSKLSLWIQQNVVPVYTYSSVSFFNCLPGLWPHFTSHFYFSEQYNRMPPSVEGKEQKPPFQTCLLLGELAFSSTPWTRFLFRRVSRKRSVGVFLWRYCSSSCQLINPSVVRFTSINSSQIIIFLHVIVILVHTSRLIIFIYCIYYFCTFRH